MSLQDPSVQQKLQTYADWYRSNEATIEDILELAYMMGYNNGMKAMNDFWIDNA